MDIVVSRGGATCPKDKNLCVPWDAYSGRTTANRMNCWSN